MTCQGKAYSQVRERPRFIFACIHHHRVMMNCGDHDMQHPRCAGLPPVLPPSPPTAAKAPPLPLPSKRPHGKPPRPPPSPPGKRAQPPPPKTLSPPKRLQHPPPIKRASSPPPKSPLPPKRPEGGASRPTGAPTLLTATPADLVPGAAVLSPTQKLQRLQEALTAAFSSAASSGKLANGEAAG